MSTIIEQLQETGIVDTHYHVGPEFFPRRYDVVTLAEAARQAGMRLVLKNHALATTALAALARRHMGAGLFGSVVLNQFVGGLNADAVHGAAAGNHAVVEDPSRPEPPFVVWMPTVHAVSHLRCLGEPFDPRWWASCAAPVGLPDKSRPVVVFDEDLRPAPELDAVLQAIARCGARLATGHLHADEIMRLVPMALERGVAGITITHPHYPSVRLSDQQLAILTRDPRVFIEHCLAIHTIEDVPLEAFADSIRVTGPEQVILSTDFGQIRSDPIPDGSYRLAREMSRRLGPRFGDSDVVRMMSVNPSRFLALEARGPDRTQAHAHGDSPPAAPV
jgi:hypothetical protein